VSSRMCIFVLSPRELRNNAGVPLHTRGSRGTQPSESKGSKLKGDIRAISKIRDRSESHPLLLMESIEEPACCRTRPGQITDDGEMAICLARALAEMPSTSVVLPSDSIAKNYVRWRKTPPVSIGAPLL